MKGKLCDPIYTTCAGQVEDEPKFLGFFFCFFEDGSHSAAQILASGSEFWNYK